MVVAVQGFIVLFSGAMAYVLAPYLAAALGMILQGPVAMGAKEASRG